MAVLVAIGVRQDCYREILGVVEGLKEDTESWRNFLLQLKQRGLSGVRLLVSDKCLELVEVWGEFYPDAAWQRCSSNVGSITPFDRDDSERTNSRTLCLPMRHHVDAARCGSGPMSKPDVVL